MKKKKESSSLFLYVYLRIPKMSCQVWHEIKCCTVNGRLIVGDNTTLSGNGLASTSNEPEILIIPPSINGVEIKEIGQYSFYQRKKIRRLVIEARIEQIGSHAFFGCEVLDEINIPNSLTMLCHSAIDLFNSSRGSVTNPGTTRIYFEANSKLKYITSHSHNNGIFRT